MEGLTGEWRWGEGWEQGEGRRHIEEKGGRLRGWEIIVPRKRRIWVGAPRRDLRWGGIEGGGGRGTGRGQKGGLNGAAHYTVMLAGSQCW